MDNHGQWNMNRYCFNNQRKRRNSYQPYQDYHKNFNRNWNSPVGYEAEGYQADFRSNRGMNRQQFRMGPQMNYGNNNNNNNNNNNRKRRHNFGDNMGWRNSWAHENKNCFKGSEAMNFIPVHKERKPFYRESSLPPVVMRNRVNSMNDSRKVDVFDDRSNQKVNKTRLWPDSESKSRDSSWVDSEIEHKSQESEVSENAETTPILKEEHKLISTIWSEESEDEESGINSDKFSSLSKGRAPFKYSTNSIPRYDGKFTAGEEGVFKIEVFHCTFCNIISMDQEKSNAHLLTKYHYKRYKKEIERCEEASGSDNAKAQ